MLLRCDKLCDTIRALYRRVAQLVRALGRHPRGRWFESNRAYQTINGLDQKGLARFSFDGEFWVTFLTKLFPPNHCKAAIDPTAFICDAV